MIKKTIKYEDFNGEQVEEDFYFNLTEAEIVELEVSGENNSFAESIKKIVAANDGKQIIEEFKKLLLLAVGVKSEDGRRFVKNEEIRNDFLNSPAYSEMFMSLIEGDNASDFVRGVLPAKMSKAMDTNTQVKPGQPQDFKKKEVSNIQTKVEESLPGEEETPSAEDEAALLRKKLAELEAKNKTSDS